MGQFVCRRYVGIALDVEVTKEKLIGVRILERILPSKGDENREIKDKRCRFRAIRCGQHFRRIIRDKILRRIN